MAEAVVTKRCSRCNTEKPITEFPGQSGYCKPCAAEYQRAYVKTANGHAAKIRGHKKWAHGPKGKARSQRPDVCAYRKAKQRRYEENNPLKMAARLEVKKARKRGAIPRPSELRCAHCGAQASDYHHHRGYEPEHALDVIPLCRACHQQAG